MIATSIESAGIPEKVQELEDAAMEELELEESEKEDVFPNKMKLFQEPKEIKPRKEKRLLQNIYLYLMICQLNLEIKVLVHS